MTLTTNPLVRPLQTRRHAIHLAVLLVAVVGLWTFTLWLMAHARWKLISGPPITGTTPQYHLAGVLQVVIWLLPVLTFVLSVSRMQQLARDPNFYLIRSTTVSTRTLTIGYALQTMFWLRWLLLLSPLLLVITGLHHETYGLTVVLPIDTLPLTVTWLLLHVVAVSFGTFSVLRWGEGRVLFLYVIAGGAATAAFIVLLDESLTYTCPLHVTIAPIPWVLVIALLSAAILALYCLEFDSLQVGALEIVFGTAMLVAIIVGPSWFGSWQRIIEQRATRDLFQESDIAHWDWDSYCSLPQVVCSCGRVQEFFLPVAFSDDTLPASINTFYYLKSLGLTQSPGLHLPAEVAELDHLRNLNLRGVGLAEVPAPVFDLTSLLNLTLSANQLTELPTDVARLRYLESLSLTGNNISVLPPEIGEVTTLRSLYIEGNGLEALPPEVGSLTQLEFLFVASNHLAELPPEVGSLRALRQADFSGNQLTALPDEAGQWSSLRALELGENNLSEVPVSIYELPQLERLLIDGNPITAVPSDIEIKNLTTLSTLDTDIDSLPVAVCLLENLNVNYLTCEDSCSVYRDC